MADENKETTCESRDGWGLEVMRLNSRISSREDMKDWSCWIGASSLVPPPALLHTLLIHFHAPSPPTLSTPLAPYILHISPMHPFNSCTSSHIHNVRST